MHKIFFVLIFFGINQIKAQDNFSNLKITYNYESFGGFETDMNLYIKNQKSRYIHQINYTETSIGEDDSKMSFFYYPEYYTYIKQSMDSLVYGQRILADGVPISANWQFGEIEWTMTDEFDEISGFKVQKAIAPDLKKKTGIALADYDPGNAVAWFAIDLPLPYGPEGYDGLPGLIIKLGYENTKNGTCTLQSIEKVELDDNFFMQNLEGIEVSKDEFFSKSLIDKTWLKEQKQLHKNDYDYKKLKSIFK